MTDRPPMPSEQAVRDALLDLRADAETTGRHPSVLALAARVGLPNTTFRRRYPNICAELTNLRAGVGALAGAMATVGTVAAAILTHERADL